MPALDFPPSAVLGNNPSIGDVWPLTGPVRWRYSGNLVWRSVAQVSSAGAGAGGGVIFSATPPTDHTVLWHDTIDNTLNYWGGSTWVSYFAVTASDAGLTLGGETLTLGGETLTFAAA